MAAVIDPYAKVNERLRSKRRAQGRRDDELDALIRAASQELGAATEAALGVFVDVAERVGLRYLEEAAKIGGATGPLQFAPKVVRAARATSARLPGASGRLLSNSSEAILHSGFSILRKVRRLLEDTRHKVKPSGGGGRPPPPGDAGPAGPRRKPPAPDDGEPTTGDRRPARPTSQRPDVRPGAERRPSRPTPQGSDARPGGARRPPRDSKPGGARRPPQKPAAGSSGDRRPPTSPPIRTRLPGPAPARGPSRVPPVRPITLLREDRPPRQPEDRLE